MQARYVKCCGVNSYKDYFTTSSSTTPFPFVTTTASITNTSSTNRAPTTVASTSILNTTVVPLNTTVVPQNTTVAVNSTGVRRRRDADDNDDDDDDNDEKESVPQSCCKNSDGSSCHYKDLKGLKPEEMGIYTEVKISFFFSCFVFYQQFCKFFVNYLDNQAKLWFRLKIQNILQSELVCYFSGLL